MGVPSPKLISTIVLKVYHAGYIILKVSVHHACPGSDTDLTI